MKDDLIEKVLQPKTIKNKNNGCGTAPGNLVFHFMAIMAHIVMAIHMVFMGVSSKNSKNADQQSKRFLKIWKW